MAVRLEVGPIALEIIRNRVPSRVTPDPLVFQPIGGGLFDLPIILDETMRPGAWRFVDADGNVMQEGTVLPRRYGWFAPSTTMDPRAAIRVTGT